MDVLKTCLVCLILLQTAVKGYADIRGRGSGRRIGSGIGRVIGSGIGRGIGRGHLHYPRKKWDFDDVKDAFTRLKWDMKGIADGIKELKEEMHRLQGNTVSEGTDDLTRLQEEVRECREQTRRSGRYGVAVTSPVEPQHRGVRSSSVIPLDANHTIFEHLLKVMVRRSCAAWKNMGFDQSGYYLIDPDGTGVGNPPIQVFCDMFTGFTFIHHDAEDTFSVNNCSGAGCYSRKVTYSAPDEQINALIHLSESCQQFIKIDCMETALSDAEDPLSWWSGRGDNVGNIYWSGSADDQHICACGHTGGCINPRHKCNCDSAMTGAWLTDQGHLSNKQHLPVTELHLGSKQTSTTKLNITLGPLRCFGTSTFDIPETCEDLRSQGTTTTGYHFLGKPDDLKLAFCNLQTQQISLDPQQELQHQEIEFNNTVILNVTDVLRSLESRVVFSVMRSNGLSSPGLIIYDIVLINVGGGFSEESSMFVVPKDAKYFLMSSSYKHDSSDARIDIKRNNRVITFAISHTTESYNNIIASTVTELKAGDEISVHLQYGGGLGGGSDGRIQFLGFSLE